MLSAGLRSGGLLELDRKTAMAHAPNGAPAVGFGVHLTLDGYGGSRRWLADADHIRARLSELPELLGMHKLIEPIVVEVGELSDKDPGGLSGYVLIAESHISIHTFPLRGFVSADVYTCQDSLDAERIRQYFEDAFELQDVETNLIRRGTRYPQDNIYESA
jgi:S-adenosylmethionine decarboxylase